MLEYLLSSTRLFLSKKLLVLFIYMFLKSEYLASLTRVSQHFSSGKT